MRLTTLLALALAAGQFPPPHGAAAAEPTHTVVIDLFKFAPATIEVAVGDRVAWTNGDLVPHTATADDGNWSTGEIKHGATGAFTPTQPGTFAYHCKFHPQMKGVIVVTARGVSP